MAKNKTTHTDASVADYLAARGTPQQVEDCGVLIACFESVTGHAAKMWGPSIVGFGMYRYTYASGHSGEAPELGFAIRGREIVVYLWTEGEAQAALLAKVGKYKMGKACFYFKQLADLDREVFEQLVVNSVAAIRRRYP